jgi:hypothetical protein
VSDSRVFYQAYEVATGEAVGPISGYEDALYEALLQETHRLIEIQDIEYGTREALAAALDKTKCAVRFVRAERLSCAPGRSPLGIASEDGGTLLDCPDDAHW